MRTIGPRRRGSRTDHQCMATNHLREHGVQRWSIDRRDVRGSRPLIASPSPPAKPAVRQRRISSAEHQVMRRFRAQVRGVVESSPAERNCLPTSSFCCCSLCRGLLAPSVVSCLSSSSCTQYQCLLDSRPRFDARQRYSSEGRWYRSKRASLPPLIGVSIWTMSLVRACSLFCCGLGLCMHPNFHCCCM